MSTQELKRDEMLRDPMLVYVMTEALTSLEPDKVSGEVREKFANLWRTAGGLIENEEALVAGGVTPYEFRKMKTFLQYDLTSKKKQEKFNTSKQNATASSTPKAPVATPLAKSSLGIQGPLMSSTAVLEKDGPNMNGDPNHNTVELENDDSDEDIRNPTSVPVVLPEPQKILAEIKDSMRTDIYDSNDQNQVNKQVNSLTQNMLKLMKAVDVVLGDNTVMKLKIETMNQEIISLRSEKDTYASKVIDFREIQKQQRFTDKHEQKEIRRKKKDENVGRQLILFGQEETVTKKDDGSNLKEYFMNEKTIAFKEAHRTISCARAEYADRKVRKPVDFQENELIEAPDPRDLVIDDIEYTSRIRPKNKSRVGLSEESPTFKRFDEKENRYVDYDKKRWCKLTTTFYDQSWNHYVKECQEYLVTRGNKKFETSGDPKDIVRRTIQPYLTENAKHASRELNKQAKADEIRRWGEKNLRLAKVRDNSMTRVAFDKWLKENREDSPSFIQKIMYARDGWPELKIVRYIAGKSSRHVDIKLYDDESKE